MHIRFNDREEFRAYLTNSDFTDPALDGNTRWHRMIEEAERLTDDLSLEEELEKIDLESWEHWYEH